jgi:CDP-4-dehydro-6-deoxyglucose reductase, E1
VGGNGVSLITVTDATISAAFPGADELMHRALLLGTSPGLTTAMLDYEIEVIRQFTLKK